MVLGITPNTKFVYSLSSYHRIAADGMDGLECFQIFLIFF